MARGKPRTRQSSSAPVTTESAASVNITTQPNSLYKWFSRERQGLLWVLGCTFLGFMLGFGIGTGHLFVGRSDSSWRVALANRIRSTKTYKTLKAPFRLSSSKPENPDDLHAASQARIFAVLRESIVRLDGGYVHPDLGFLDPAPCGAPRGVGMIGHAYHECQVRCIPGVASEKLENHGVDNPDYVASDEDQIYQQEEVLIKVPFEYQMTRQAALDTFQVIVPQDVLIRAPLEQLDDAALLVMLLAHERGRGVASRWLPYIASLPIEPTCGYNPNIRDKMLDAIIAYDEEIGIDVRGWPAELVRAHSYALKICTSLEKDYGPYLESPRGVSTLDNLQWALCQVASRASAGRKGVLRLVPLLDHLNHHVTAGALVELRGTEDLKMEDVLDASSREAGTYMQRNMRHGRRRALKLSQELLANYNLPHYTALDWFLNIGFVPPEKWSDWVVIDPVLQQVRQDGPFDPLREATHSEWIKTMN